MPDSVIVARLRAAGCVFAEDEARLLMSAARTPAELDAMVGQRAAGLPLEQVLGWAEFCGLRITVTPGVFVPRRRTEFLVRQAASLARRGDVIVDLCCGAGAIGAALAAAVKGVEVYAADVLTVIGKLHPDKKIAKLARKSAYKAASRQAARRQDPTRPG